jgi:hypothetical protein
VRQLTLLPFFFQSRKRLIHSYNINSVKLSSKRKTSRSGVSPVIATTIILAITITLGLGLWSFANSGVSTATSTYANVITDYGDFVGDRFTIANVAFNYPSNDYVTFWIYNSGRLATDISNVTLTCKDCTVGQYNIAPGNLSGPHQDDPSNLTLASKQLGNYTFDANKNGSTSIPSGKTFELTVISKTGASQTFVKKSG